MNAILSAALAIFQIIGLILFKLYGWVVIVAILGYLIWQNTRRQKWVSETEHVLLQIDVPKENEKKELSAEQMFASLHGILRPSTELLKEGALQEHISFEIASYGNQIRFYVWTPKHLKDFVEGQIYAQYPNVVIREGVEDYAGTEVGDRVVMGTELDFTKSDVLPIKTFVSFEVDPLAGLTAVLAKLDHAGEEMLVQVLARPVDDNWASEGEKMIAMIKNGKGESLLSGLRKGLVGLLIHIVGNMLGALTAPPGGDKKDDKKKDDKKDDDKLSVTQKSVVAGIEGKITKLGYRVKVRIVYMGPSPELAKQRMQAIMGGFKQFNTVNLNGFTNSKSLEGQAALDEYRARLFLDQGMLLNIEELASLYHLPHLSVETPNMVWTSTKTGEPPANLPTEGTLDPEEVSLFGLTNYRGHNQKFGIKRGDRGRHLYTIGQTGTGKSKFLELLTLSDLYHNKGLAIVDPHGDFATNMMKFIPEHRIKDVIYFNPTDRDFPIAFNPLQVNDPNFKHDVSTELVGVMKRMFESWGPRLEHILRFTTLALLDYPDSTMLDITRMLTEKEFRKRVVKNVEDPVVKAFWVNEFAGWNDKFANEAVAPVLNKVGAFTANPLIRNVIGQPKSTMDLRQIMDEGKILIVNLSHGQIGEINAGILGALLVTKFQLAAMSRADTPEPDRRPFYLYVDEFQNFATDSFAVILSEARKYGLYLTVANQFIAQMPDTVKEAVFGNVGSLISFRVGAGDSTFLGKYFEPVFETGDLVRLNNQHIVVNMSIDGEKAMPFSATTLRMPDPQKDYTAQIIEHSRQTYAKPRVQVEEDIAKSRQLMPEEGGQVGVQTASSPDEQKPNILRELQNPGGGQVQNRHQGNQTGQRQHYQAPKPTEHAPVNAVGTASNKDLEAGQAVNLRK